MASCEKCWKDAGGNYHNYIRLVQERSCKPEEQAGKHSFECAYCNRMTIHQHTFTCINPDCEAFNLKPPRKGSRLIQLGDHF